MPVNPQQPAPATHGKKSSPSIFRRLPKLRLPRRVSRWFWFFALLIAAAGYYIVGTFEVRAAGLVAGNLTPVTSLYEARVTKILQPCNSVVTKDQALVELAHAQLTMQQEENAYTLASRMGRTRAALEIAGQQTKAAQARYIAALARSQRALEQRRTYDVLYAADAVGKSIWQSAKAEYEQTSAEAQVAQALWRSEAAQLHAAGRDLEVAQSLVKSDPSKQGTAAAVGDLTLYAPHQGTMVSCEGHVGDVVKPGENLFRIFDPEKAYVTAYVRPNDANRLKPGMHVEVTSSSGGLARRGNVEWVDPAATPLPEALRRYFWQNVQWAQYTPVRVTLEPIAIKNSNADLLSFGATVNVSIRLSSK